MCGFVAIASRDSSASILRDRLILGIRLIEHRGPDDEAFYFSQEYCAGFRRLSIIDLSDCFFEPKKSIFLGGTKEVYAKEEAIGLDSVYI